MKIAPRACVVCKVTDARLLSVTELDGGQRVTVCGSHQIAHERGARRAGSVEELARLLGEKRGAGPRRLDGEGDELGAQLARAFAGERRQSGERRR